MQERVSARFGRILPVGETRRPPPKQGPPPSREAVSGSPPRTGRIAGQSAGDIKLTFKGRALLSPAPAWERAVRLIRPEPLPVLPVYSRGHRPIGGCQREVEVALTRRASPPRLLPDSIGARSAGGCPSARLPSPIGPRPRSPGKRDAPACARVPCAPTVFPHRGRKLLLPFHFALPQEGMWTG